MPMVTPTLNLPQPSTSSSASAKTTAAVVPPPAAPAPSVPMAKMPDAPSTTVTLSPQAMSALASSAPSSGSTAAAPAAGGGSLYDSLKNDIATAVDDVGDAVVDGVETTVSTANKVVTGIIEMPFAAVAKACDAIGALINEL